MRVNQPQGLRALCTSLVFALAAVCTSPTVLAAQDPNVALLGPYVEADASLPLYEVRVRNPRSDGQYGAYDAVVFSKRDTNEAYDRNPAVKTSHLSWYTSTLAANIDLFAVKAGDVFSSERVAAGAFTSMLSGADILAPLHLTPTWGTFYLGVQVLVPPEMASGWQGSMGWLMFQTRPGNRLVLVDSLIAYDASSIVVGQVPESGSLALALAGLGLVALRRRTHP